jgi:hypothetical protein
MKEDDTKTSEAKEKADLLNSSFGKKFSTQPIANPPPTLPKQPIRELMYMTTISIENVLKRLERLDANKAAGSDNLQPRLLKEAAE